MAQYEMPVSTAPGEAPARSRKWPLAGVMIIDLVLIVIVILITTIVIGGIFIGVRAFQQGGLASQNQDELLKLLGPDGTFTILLVQNAVFMLVPILRIAVLRREPLAEIGFRAPEPGRLLLLGVGMAAVMYAGSIALSLAFAQFGIQQDQAEQFKKQFSLAPGDFFGQILFLVGGGLLAPIGEETLFRGYVFNAIRLTFGTKRWGIPLAYLASALVFAVIHFSGATQGTIALIVPIFFIALVLAWGMHRTGSLLPGIVAHALFNSVQLVALTYCINNPGTCPNF
ncbi:MAG TPA: CPBP family intramembrane glutamic endopeptidase [Roseiflexaceae bacterium]|nr:CPBP family intramembrane glutamic endopeptidase [Roseiflexaceae bacterium]